MGRFGNPARTTPTPRKTTRTAAFRGEPTEDAELYALPVDPTAPLDVSLPTTRGPLTPVPSSPGSSTGTSVTSSGSSFPRKYTLRCYGCKEIGHGILECPLLTEEQRAIFRRAHGSMEEAKKKTPPPNQGPQGLRNLAADAHQRIKEPAPVLQLMEGTQEDSNVPQGNVDGGDHLGLNPSVLQK